LSFDNWLRLVLPAGSRGRGLSAFRMRAALPRRMADLAAPLAMAWSAFTRAEFGPRPMSGGHFYLNDDTAA
jgi:hypothetical protein